MTEPAQKRSRKDAGDGQLTLTCGPCNETQRSTLVAMWEADELCDIKVLVEGQSFAAHRVVLASGSAYMRARFNSSMSDGGAVPQIELQDVPAEGFRLVLEFLYCGSIQVSGDSLTVAMMVASRLEVASLLISGATLMTDHVTPETAAATWVTAAELQRPVELLPLVQACRAMFCKSFAVATAADAFLTLSASQLAEVLGSDDVDAKEVDVFHALVRWERAQQPTEDDRLGPLLRLIRFRLVEATDLLDTVQSEPLVAARLDMKDVLLDAFRYHALPAARRDPVSSHRVIRWNPDDKHEWVQLSSDGLEVSYGGPDDHQQGLNGLVRATRGWSSGRNYFEFTLPNASADGNGYPSVGVVAADVTLGGESAKAGLVIGGPHGRGWGWHTNEMQKVHATDPNSFDMIGEESPTVPDGLDEESVYGVLLDIEARTLELYVDGELIEDATHTDVGCGAPLFAAVEAGTLQNRRFRFNFKATPPK